MKKIVSNSAKQTKINRKILVKRWDLDKFYEKIGKNEGFMIVKSSNFGKKYIKFL